MDKSFNQNIQHILPMGLGYFRLLVNSRSEAEDFMFLDINPAFERLTGCHREDVLGKRVSEIYQNNKQNGFYWLSYCESVVRSGKAQETTQWIEALQQYLKIVVIPSDQMSFMVVIRDAYEEEPLPALEDMDVVFNSTHDAISLIEYRDGEFRYIRNNTVHQRLTGFCSIKGISIKELLGKEVAGTLSKYYQQCMSTGRPVSYEQRFNFAPGKRVWQTEVTPVFSNGRISYLLCTSKDISELKKVQGEKEVLAQRLQSMFDRHTAVMLIIEPISGKIIDANPAACEFYGYSKGELQGLLISDINMLPSEEVEKHRLKSGDVRLVDVYTCPIFDGENTLLYSIIFDVTDREAYRNELFQEKEVLFTTLRSIGDGVVTTDSSGIITSLNLVAQDITGWKNDEAKGRLFTDLFLLQNEETGDLVENPIQKVLETGRIVGLANHTVLVNRHKQTIPIADSAAPIKAESGQILGVVMVFRDVSNEKEHSKQIQFLSYHDPLTGLFNRRYIEEKMNRLDIAENLPISVVMGDVNGLKVTNDVFGHEAGDALLRHMAESLKKNCRKNDLIARWGGDEVVIFMPRTSLAAAEEIIQRIKNDYINVDEGGLHMSISFGCAIKETLDESIQAVMREAEEYMYHQKLLDGKSYRNSIINTLLATLYEKSNETEEHSKRMEKYCHSIGRKLQFSSKELDEISLLAILHDIGKVSINPSILQKPGSLTPAEWDEMKRHTEVGYRIAQATPELANVADFILSHHERWDGNGYPRGLKGEEIPLPCRILAVTDAFDAMTNDRVYRRAMSREKAILELERNSSAQFDPEIVSLFIQNLQTEIEMNGFEGYEQAKGGGI